MTAFTLRMLRDDADHEAALEELGQLWGVADGTPEADQLGVLTLLIDDYERRAHALGLPDPIDAILFRMESQGLTRKDLERFIGSSGRVSEVLSRKRGLSIEMIRRLHAGLGIPLDVLVQPTGAPEAATEARVVEVVGLPPEVGQAATAKRTFDPTLVAFAKAALVSVKKSKAKKGKYHRDQASVTINYLVPHSGGGWAVKGSGYPSRQAIEEHDPHNEDVDEDASDHPLVEGGEGSRPGGSPA